MAVMTLHTVCPQILLCFNCVATVLDFQGFVQTMHYCLACMPLKAVHSRDLKLDI